METDKACLNWFARRVGVELYNGVESAGKYNVAFTAALVVGDVEKCLDILCQTKRIPEAALMARTYAPTQVPRLVALWKAKLAEEKKTKMSEAIASPAEHSELFPDFDYAVFAEDGFKRRKEKGAVPAGEYLDWKDSLDWDVIDRTCFFGMSSNNWNRTQEAISGRTFQSSRFSSIALSQCISSTRSCCQRGRIRDSAISCFYRRCGRNNVVHEHGSPWCGIHQGQCFW